MLPSPDENPEALDEAVEEALDGERLRSDDWNALSQALMVRRERIERDLSLCEDPHEHEALQERLDEIDAQIQILNEEANISRFVEDTVKFSYEVRRLSDG